MGLLSGMSGSMDSLAKGHGRRKSDASGLSATGPAVEKGAEGNAYATTNLDKEQGNVLMSIIPQCEY